MRKHAIIGVAKQKKQQRRAKRKKEARNNLTPEEIFYDDRFFFIAGHTTGGAPYGVTWLPVVTYVEILIYRRASLDRCFGTFALKRFWNHRYGDHHCRVGIFLKALIMLSFAARATGGMIHTYDKEKDTEYCETLYQYLNCSLSLKKTCDVLFYKV